MHDVVRDYCRGSVEPARLQAQQRALIRLIIGATPAKGWLHTAAEPLSAWVHGISGGGSTRLGILLVGYGIC